MKDKKGLYICIAQLQRELESARRRLSVLEVRDHRAARLLKGHERELFYGILTNPTREELEFLDSTNRTFRTFKRR